MEYHLVATDSSGVTLFNGTLESLATTTCNAWYVPSSCK